MLHQCFKLSSDAVQLLLVETASSSTARLEATRADWPTSTASMHHNAAVRVLPIATFFCFRQRLVLQSQRVLEFYCVCALSSAVLQQKEREREQKTKGLDLSSIARAHVREIFECDTCSYGSKHVNFVLAEMVKNRVAPGEERRLR